MPSRISRKHCFGTDEKQEAKPEATPTQEGAKATDENEENTAGPLVVIPIMERPSMKDLANVCLSHSGYVER